MLMFLTSLLARDFVSFLLEGSDWFFLFFFFSSLFALSSFLSSIMLLLF